MQTYKKNFPIIHETPINICENQGDKTSAFSHRDETYKPAFCISGAIKNHPENSIGADK